LHADGIRVLLTAVLRHDAPAKSTNLKKGGLPPALKKSVDAGRSAKIKSSSTVEHTSWKML